MTYTELRDAVYVLTNRPDMVAETQRAIQSATLEIHARDKWARDIIETTITLDTPQQSEFQLPFGSKFPRMRGTELVICQVYDTTTGTKGNKLEKIAAGDVFDPYGYNRTEVYYAAGANLSFKVGYAIDAIAVAYYAYPVVTPIEDYDSWIATEFPHVIYQWAAIKMLASIGKLDASNKLTEHFTTFTWPGFQASVI